MFANPVQLFVALAVFSFAALIIADIALAVVVVVLVRNRSDRRQAALVAPAPRMRRMPPPPYGIADTIVMPRARVGGRP